MDVVAHGYLAAEKWIFCKLLHTQVFVPVKKITQLFIIAELIPRLPCAASFLIGQVCLEAISMQGIGAGVDGFLDHLFESWIAEVLIGGQ